MKTFKLSNTTDSVMLVVFEPIGDIFSLPAKENIEILVFDDRGGIADNSLEIQFDVDNGKATVTIWAEKHDFEARYKGHVIN